MAEPMKSRFAIDLDDLERQLRDTASTQPKAPPADPLAELARIVGQDDPFKSLFADKPAARPVTASAQMQQSAPVASQSPGYQPQPAPPLPAPVPGVSPSSGASQPGRVEPSIDDLLRDFDLAMEKADAATQRATIPPRSGAASSAPPPTASAPAASMPAAADPMVDAFDALLRDDLRADQVHGDASRASTAPVMARDARDLDHDVDQVRVGSRMQAVRQEPHDIEDRGDFQDARDMRDDLPPDYPEPPTEPVEDMRSLEPQQPRKGLMIAAGLMGVAALGIGAVVGLGGFFGGGSASAPGGEVPLVRAETGPAKVQPANPGGVDIPNQNKQIFERAGEAKPADTRVVNREEQPMDVQAAARQAARVILPAPGADNQSSGPASNQATAGAPVTPGVALAPPLAAPLPPQATVQPAQPPALGEPRRVRTVSVRPDGTIAPPPGAPDAVNGAPAAQAPQAAPVRPAQQPITTGSAPVVVRAPTPPAPPRAPSEPARQQVAAAPPAAPVAPPRAAEPAAPRAGGWMVQLAAPGSEAEARATFATLQRRHAGELSGETPIVRRAEANGRTVYRLRIGPYGSRDQAIAKCEALKADGGACFVASN